MLVRDVARELGPRVKVSIEEYGHSPMATRFGVRRYPVVFVDDVLFARPKDFGFGGKEDTSGGVYLPWLEPANQRRFKSDLQRLVERRLAGEAVAGHAIGDVTTPDSTDGPATLPSLPLKDLDGQAIDSASLAGRAVVVEMWATWCGPCRSTLSRLNDVQRRYASRATILAVAVDSSEADVRAMMKTINPRYHVVLGSKDVIEAFGAVAAVPKLLVFDRAGRRSQVIYGAPPDLHQQLDAAIAAAAGSGAVDRRD